MSVSDPLIKDIKGCTLNFLTELNNLENILDTNATLVRFCQTLENIFIQGLKTSCNTLGFIKYTDPWTWLENVGATKHNLITFSYRTSVDTVKQFRNVFTNTGRFRLLIRYCLVNKCLHVPLEFMIKTYRISTVYYENSILGDEILSQILLSVLSQYRNMNFKLNLKISSFLDLSWRIPEAINFELVPSENLGLSVSFAGEKAIIVQIASNSVISETGQVQAGDVLDNLNGVHICRAIKGRLQNVLRLNKGQPNTVSIIKAIYADTKETYPPIIALLKQVHIDPDILKSRFYETETHNEECLKVANIKNGTGFKAKYVGYVEMGNRGDIKLIDKAAKMLLSPNSNYSLDTMNSVRKMNDVSFEIGELGVKVVDKNTSEVILKHSYMEISSCGSVSFLNNYFAYIAGDQYCNIATKFTCYIFSTNNFDSTYTILQSIGQGFQRTHFAV